MELDTKTIEICLNIAKGCHDYQGGYRNKEDNEIFHHGIQTVVNCLTRLSKDQDLSDTQLNTIHSIGSQS